MELKIFNVEHGACALLTCDNGTRLMVDAGHNASTDWRPGNYLRNIGVTKLEYLAITNYDEDHVSAIDSVFDQVFVQMVFRNTSVSTSQIRWLKTTDGMGPGIDRLVRQLDATFLPPGAPGVDPILPLQGVELQMFHNLPTDFDDENNLSLVLHLRCHGTGILFTGDLETAGWQKLLEQPAFRTALSRTNILIASHHGRVSGCCDAVFGHCSPQLVVISDKEHMHDTQQTGDYYAARAGGAIFRSQQRKVVTTRRDGDLRFTFASGQWWGH